MKPPLLPVEWMMSWSLGVQGRAVLEQQARNYILQIERMQSTEVELRKQLEANGEKYQEFQELITKSNEVS